MIWWIIGPVIYGVGGVLTGCLTVWAGKRRRDDEPEFAGIMTGLFWPIGLWFAVGMCCLLLGSTFTRTRTRVEFKDLDNRETALRRRKKILELDIEEQQIRLAELEFERRRMREIER